ncbi:hypothetical protein CAPTEDRAFT_221669 [Capitella teleta]|uniref:Cilia- and flagella-associated protein 126 n=1 Tax=Capitella teleta TaxID=283909 RepID=R7TR74_CAPTE|nr:hypothetical protein CAPTEDRAFT_221669 [Capitella teleta]|eukprot:ELT93535.1 hypothetical protein CAPTEDRAFT_221669 [Capitella teleta]
MVFWSDSLRRNESNDRKKDKKKYQNAFYAKKLQNWQVPGVYQSHPRSRSGHTKFIATDRGHLMGDVPRSRKNPWGDFVGTWDLPHRIPGHSVQVPTARTTHAQERVQREQKDSSWVINGGLKNSTRRNFDTAYASKNPPVFPGAENPPDQASLGYMHPLSPAGQRSGAAAPATSMFPAIGTTNPANNYSCTCGSGHDQAPSPTNRIPTPGLANSPPPMTSRLPSPPAGSPFRASSGLIAL